MTDGHVGVAGHRVHVASQPSERILILGLSIESASAIVAKIRAGEISCRQAVQQRIDAIEQVNSALNALVVERFDQALEEADVADRVPSSERGCMHGLPVTIKEMFDVAGLPTTAGIRSLAETPVRRDADLVASWRHAGAIVLGKSNVPQVGMMVDSANPVYGRTNNPWDLDRGPGGSSGGEAALLAAGATVLGLASDGGGSIRQPASWSGVCGFKPTGGRYSMDGHWTSANWPADWAVPGPMARTVDDLVLGLSGFQQPDTAQNRLPPTRLELPDESSVRRLRVGYYEQFDDLPAAPAIRRAVRDATDALARQGVEVVAFEPPDPWELWSNYLAIFYAEGLRDVKRQIGRDPVDPQIRQILQMTRLPGWLRPLACKIQAWMGERRIGHVLSTLKRPVLSADEYCLLLQTMMGYRRGFTRRMNHQRVDAIVAPAAPMPAVPHGDFHANFGFIYTGIYNLLAVPAGVVPVTRVTAADLEATTTETSSRDGVDKSLAKANRDSAGLPIGVQVIGRIWDDERVLGIMRLLEANLPALGNPAVSALSSPDASP